MDERTGVQALERKHPDLPMLPGHVLRREFEYVRHGTLSWFINFDVVTGHVIEPILQTNKDRGGCIGSSQTSEGSRSQSDEVASHAGQLEYPSVRIVGAMGSRTGGD
jgi:hypothetical protein